MAALPRDDCPPARHPQEKETLTLTVITARIISHSPTQSSGVALCFLNIPVIIILAPSVEQGGHPSGSPGIILSMKEGKTSDKDREYVSFCVNLPPTIFFFFRVGKYMIEAECSTLEIIKAPWQST